MTKINIKSTSDEKAFKEEDWGDGFFNPIDHREAIAKVLSALHGDVSTTKVYTLFLKDTANLEKPVAIHLYVYPDGRVRCHELPLEDIEMRLDTADQEYIQQFLDEEAEEEQE